MNKQRGINAVFFIAILVLISASVDAGSMSGIFAALFSAFIAFGYIFFTTKG